MQHAPKAPDESTAQAWKERRRRRRMLEGNWQSDLRERIVEMVGGRRAAAWGQEDLAHNDAKSIVTQLSMLYNAPAHTLHESADAVESLKPWLDDAGHWQIMQGFMPLIVGQREGLVRAEVVPHPVTGALRLCTRSHPADLVAVRAHPDAPDEPTWLAEYRVRLNPQGHAMWTRDVFDLSDPANPYHRVEDEDGVPLPQFDAHSGEEYTKRWSYASGVPFIPGEWYHAQRTGRIEDHRTGLELFEGALQLAAYWTMWGHVIRDASWPQRYTVGMRLAGAESRDGDGMPYVETDPSSLLNFEAEPGVTALAGQFQPGGDPKSLAESLAGYSSKLAVGMEIAPSDLARATGDARSGYAIELTSEGKRAAQRRYAMSFERHDVNMISKIAAMLTRSGAATIPDTGWSVSYQGIPLTQTEKQDQLTELQTLIEMNLISRVEALARHEGIPLETARRRLEESAADIARFRA